MCQLIRLIHSYIVGIFSEPLLITFSRGQAVSQATSVWLNKRLPYHINEPISLAMQLDWAAITLGGQGSRPDGMVVLALPLLYSSKSHRCFIRVDAACCIKMMLLWQRERLQKQSPVKRLPLSQDTTPSVCVSRGCLRPRAVYYKPQWAVTKEAIYL